MANEIRVEKCFYDLNEYMDYSGFLTQAEVPYLVFGVEEELAALNAVREASPETLENLTRQTLEISERINQDIFKVLVTMRWMCSAEAMVTMNRNRVLHSIPEAEANMSIRALRRYPKLHRMPRITAARSAWDSEGNVNGIDITMPVMNFSETHYFRASKVTTAYKKRLAELTGTVNNGKFKGYAPGEVLFLGASGSRRGKHSDDDWEITFRFAVSPNREI